MSVYAGPEVSNSDLVVSLDVNNIKCFDSRENLYPFSETLQSLINQRCTRQSFSTGGPFGRGYHELTATEDSEGGIYNFDAGNTILLAAGQVITFSAYFQNISLTGGVYLQCWTGAGRAWTVQRRVQYDLVAETSTVSTGTILAHSISNEENGMYRLSMTVQADQAGFSAISVNVGGVIGQVYRVTAIQVNNGYSLTEYRPTTGTALTKPNVIKNLQDNTFSNTAIINTFTDSSGVSLDYRGSSGIRVYFPEIPTYNFTLIYWGRATSQPPSNYRSTLTVKGTDDQGYFYADTREVATPSILHYTRNSATNAYITRPVLTNAEFLKFNWNQFAMVISPNRIMTSYRNGVLLNADNFYALDQSTFLNINQLHLNSSSAHNYQMQAIYLYKRTLSASEIQQNYQALRGRFGV